MNPTRCENICNFLFWPAGENYGWRIRPSFGCLEFGHFPVWTGSWTLSLPPCESVKWQWLLTVTPGTSLSSSSACILYDCVLILFSALSLLLCSPFLPTPLLTFLPPPSSPFPLPSPPSLPSPLPNVSALQDGSRGNTMLVRAPHSHTNCRPLETLCITLIQQCTICISTFCSTTMFVTASTTAVYIGITVCYGMVFVYSHSTVTTSMLTYKLVCIQWG